MTTLDEVRAALRAANDEVDRYFSELPADALYRRAAASEWAPIDDLRHLNRTVGATARGLAMPKIALLLRFGRARRPSLPYDELRARYMSLLRNGLTAPQRYAPPPAEFDDAEAYRARTLARWRDVSGALDRAIRRWSERSADRYVLPHPALGRLTIREMLYFSHGHSLHHIEVARRRVERARPSNRV